MTIPTDGIPLPVPAPAEVPNTLSLVNYVGDGFQTNFSFNFRVDSTSWLEVYLGDVLQNDATYTIDLNPDQNTTAGGWIYFLIAPADQVEIVIRRATPLSQLIQFKPYEPFPAEDNEGGLDKLTMEIQDLTSYLLWFVDGKWIRLDDTAWKIIEGGTSQNAFNSTDYHLWRHEKKLYGIQPGELPILAKFVTHEKFVTTFGGPNVQEVLDEIITGELFVKTEGDDMTGDLTFLDQSGIVFNYLSAYPSSIRENTDGDTVFDMSDDDLIFTGKFGVPDIEDQEIFRITPHYTNLPALLMVGGAQILADGDAENPTYPPMSFSGSSRITGFNCYRAGPLDVHIAGTAQMHFGSVNDDQPEFTFKTGIGQHIWMDNLPEGYGINIEHDVLAETFTLGTVATNHFTSKHKHLHFVRDGETELWHFNLGALEEQIRLQTGDLGGILYGQWFIGYDGTGSGLVSDNLQDAIDELAANDAAHLADLDNPHATSLLNLIDTSIIGPEVAHGIYWDGAQWENLPSHQLAESNPTGLIDGGELNIIGGVNVEIIGGQAIIVDSYTNPSIAPVIQPIEWVTQDEIIAFPAVAGAIVYITLQDSGVPSGASVNTLPINVGTLIQRNTSPSQAIRRDEVVIGVLVHNGTNWKEVSSPTVINNSAHTLEDYLNTVSGPSFIIDGGEVTEAALHTLDQAAGNIWEMNRNWHVSKKEPHRELLPARAPFSFRYVNRDFTDVGILGDTVNVTNYDAAGVITPIPAPPLNATIQRVYLDFADNFWILYGQNIYPTFAEALANIGADDAATTVPDLLGASIQLGYIISNASASDWASTTSRFVVGGQGGGGGGSGGSPISDHDLLNNITPNDHHNQVHLLQGTDHSDVSLTPAVIRQLLAWDGVDSFDPQYRIRWIADYTNGPTYYPQEMVADNEFIAIANTETIEPAFPTEVGPLIRTYPDPAPFLFAAQVANIRSGHQYVFQQAGEVRGIWVWVPEVSVDTNHTLVVVGDPNGTPTTTTFPDLALNPDEWNLVTSFNNLILVGQEFLIYLESQNFAGTSQVTGGWTRGANSNVAPAINSWNRSTQYDVLRIDDTDLDTVDRRAELEGIVAGSTIQFVETAQPQNSITFRVVSINIALVGYVEYEVTLQSQGINEPVIGNTTTMTADIPIAQSTQFSYETDKWLTDEPAFTSITSFLQYDDVDQAVGDDIGYGIDIQFQQLTQSADWDLIKIGGGGGGGGGDFTPATFLGAGTTGYVPDPTIEEGKFLKDDGTWDIPTAPAPVDSVFTRTGAVVALAGDYSSFYAATVHNHVEADITNLDKYTQAEVNALIPAVPVDSVHGRTGAVTGQQGDYDAFYALIGDIPPPVDLSGYLLNTTDTFTGVLRLIGSTVITAEHNFSSPGGGGDKGVFIEGTRVALGGDARIVAYNEDSGAYHALRLDADQIKLDYRGGTIATVRSGGVDIDGELTVTGDVLAGDGTVALPSLTFASDPDSGMYQFGDDQVGITAGGILGFYASALRTQLNYAGAKKLETDVLGVRISNSNSAVTLYLGNTVGTGTHLFQAENDHGRYKHNFNADGNWYLQTQSNNGNNNDSHIVLHREVTAGVSNDAFVELRYNNLEKLRTASAGIEVAGTIQPTGRINASVGTTSVTSIGPVGSNGTGILWPDNNKIHGRVNGKNTFYFTEAEAYLYYAGFHKFNTTDTGINVVGDIFDDGVNINTLYEPIGTEHTYVRRSGGNVDSLPSNAAYSNRFQYNYASPGDPLTNSWGVFANFFSGTSDSNYRGWQIACGQTINENWNFRKVDTDGMGYGPSRQMFHTNFAPFLTFTGGTSSATRLPVVEVTSTTAAAMRGDLSFDSGRYAYMHNTDGQGLRFWNNDDAAYTIYMSQASDSSWGGNVAGFSGDFNMYFQMNGSASKRGLVFRAGDASNSGSGTPYAQISSVGIGISSSGRYKWNGKRILAWGKIHTSNGGNNYTEGCDAAVQSTGEVLITLHAAATDLLSLGANANCMANQPYLATIVASTTTSMTLRTWDTSAVDTKVGANTTFIVWEC